MDYAECNLGQSVFEKGQAYVALSRVRNLEGLYITNLYPKCIKANEKALDFEKSIPQLKLESNEPELNEDIENEDEENESSYYDALACANLPTYSGSESSSSDSSENVYKKKETDEYEGYNGYNDFNERQNDIGGEGW